MLRDVAHISKNTYFLFDVTVFGICILNVQYAICVEPVLFLYISFNKVLLCSVLMW